MENIEEIKQAEAHLQQAEAALQKRAERDEQTAMHDVEEAVEELREAEHHHREIHFTVDGEEYETTKAGTDAERDHQGIRQEGPGDELSRGNQRRPQDQLPGKGRRGNQNA